MSAVKILIDEDVWPGLAEALRQAGYDAVSVSELGRRGLSDEEQLMLSAAEGRAIITHNVQDFAPLAELYFERNLPHAGIIAARQFEKGELLRRVLHLFAALTADDLANTLRFI